MTSRFLLACICSFFYDGENTLEDLHGAIAQDATKLFLEGIRVAWRHAATRFVLSAFFHHQCSTKVGDTTVRMVCCGVKGDWVFLRKARRWIDFLREVRCGPFLLALARPSG